MVENLNLFAEKQLIPEELKKVEKTAETKPIELKELVDGLIVLFDLKDIKELKEALLKALLEKDTSKLEGFVLLVNDLTIDHLQKVFQYYFSDREEKMQDFTPKCLAELISELVNGGSDVIDMCSGSGALTIQHWALGHTEIEFTMYEFDENVIPFLLFNLTVRNIKATVYHKDVLKNEIFKTYKVRKGAKFGEVVVLNEMCNI